MNAAKIYAIGTKISGSEFSIKNLTKTDNCADVMHHKRRARYYNQPDDQCFELLIIQPAKYPDAELCAANGERQGQHHVDYKLYIDQLLPDYH